MPKENRCLERIDAKKRIDAKNRCLERIDAWRE